MKERDRQRNANRVFVQTPVQIVNRRHRYASHTHDQISRDDSRTARRTALLHTRDEDRTGRREMISIRLSSRETNRLSRHADVCAAHASVTHEPRRDEFRRSRRNSEADSLRAGNDRRIHSDDVAARRSERPAGISRV